MRRPLLAAILAVLAASTLLAIQASASAPVRRVTHPLQPHASTSVKVGLHDFFITRRPKRGPHGSFTFNIHNRGAVTHNFRIRKGTSGRVIARTTNIAPGGSRTVTITLKAGRYTIFCSLHPTLMHKRFTVL
jgi:hypothetical protein